MGAGIAVTFAAMSWRNGLALTIVFLPTLSTVVMMGFWRGRAVRWSERERKLGYATDPDHSDEDLWHLDWQTLALTRLPGQSPADAGMALRSGHPPALLTGMAAARARTIEMVCGVAGAVGVLGCFAALGADSARSISFAVFAMHVAVTVAACAAVGFAVAEMVRVRRVDQELRHGYATCESSLATQYWLLNARTGAVLREPGASRLARAELRARKATRGPPTRTRG